MLNHSSKPKRPRDVNQRAKAIVDQATGEAEPEPVGPSVAPEPETPSESLRHAAAELGRHLWSIEVIVGLLD